MDERTTSPDRSETVGSKSEIGFIQFFTNLEGYPNIAALLDWSLIFLVDLIALLFLQYTTPEIVDTQKLSGDEDVVNASKKSASNESEEKDPETKVMTIEEYDKILEEKRKASNWVRKRTSTKMPIKKKK